MSKYQHIQEEAMKRTAIAKNWIVQFTFGNVSAADRDLAVLLSNQVYAL